MKKIIKIFIIIFLYSYYLHSQQCDTTLLLKYNYSSNLIIPFNKYIVENKNIIYMKSDSNSIISKDELGNYYITFDVKDEHGCNIYFKVAENPDSMLMVKLIQSPEQLYIYFLDRKGNYILTGDTIGRNKLLNKELKAETIYSYIKKTREVKSFWVVFRKDSEIYKRVIDGPIITKSLWKEIKKLPKGTPIAIIGIMIDYNGHYYPNLIDDFILYR
jgi:hypothetical protein